MVRILHDIGSDLEIKTKHCHLHWQCPKCGKINKEPYYISEGSSFKIELPCYKEGKGMWFPDPCLHFKCEYGAIFKIWMELES